MQHPVHAAQTTSARTELVAFDNSPFPYSGQPPGQDKPFYDVEKDGRRGHTSPRGGIYWEDTTYSDRRVLLHIPRGFNAALPAVMIVYLHGNFASLAGVVHRVQQVPRQVSESGLNAVGVLDAATGAAIGHIPTAWYPAQVALSPTGKTLFVTNAKGFGAGPNGGPTFRPGQRPDENAAYIGRLMRGTVSVIDLPTDAELAPLTARVMANNGLVPKAPSRAADRSARVHFSSAIRSPRRMRCCSGC